MKVGILAGSTRAKSQSRKVADYVKERATAQGRFEGYELVDLADSPVAIWKEGEHLTPNWEATHAAFSSCDAFIFVVPEWDGMVPGAAKNFFHMFTSGELAHKPGLIVSISAGVNGAYPVQELRMSSYKNTRICYLPEHIIVRNVNSVLNHVDACPTDSESELRDRIDYCLHLLSLYGESLQSLHARGEIDLQAYPYGM